MTAIEIDRATRCEQGFHYKVKRGGIWMCVHCMALCTQNCGRRVAVEGTMCLRCNNPRSTSVLP